MADRTTIQWTDATWNPIAGCNRVSEGCRHCYAERLAARGLPGFEGLARFVDHSDGTREARWTGAVTVREHLMDQPLRWRRPRRIFVNSVSDLFHDAVPDEVIDRIFTVMALAPQHTFQILTKRPERMRRYLAEDRRGAWADAWAPGTLRLSRHEIMARLSPRATPDQRWLYNAERILWPLPNVQLGVSVEDQVTADTRIPYLLDTPAAIRFASYEPALGPIDWRQQPDRDHWRDWLTGDSKGYLTNYSGLPRIDLVIMGGESGPNARPMHPDWARQTRDQCTAAGVPFLFKQWGEWAPSPNGNVISFAGGSVNPDIAWPDGTIAWGDKEDHGGHGQALNRVGRRAAGRLLDGVEHNGMPEVRP